MGSPIIMQLANDESIQKVKRMQRAGTEAIRTQISPQNQLGKQTKLQIIKIQRTYGQLKQLLSEKRPLHATNQNRSKSDMNTLKVNHHRNSDTGNRQQRTTTDVPPWNETVGRRRHSPMPEQR